jgi:hypothetical protein
MRTWASSFANLLLATTALCSSIVGKGTSPSWDPSACVTSLNLSSTPSNYYHPLGVVFNVVPGDDERTKNHHLNLTTAESVDETLVIGLSSERSFENSTTCGLLPASRSFSVGPECRFEAGFFLPWTEASSLAPSDHKEYGEFCRNAFFVCVEKSPASWVYSGIQVRPEFVFRSSFGGMRGRRFAQEVAPPETNSTNDLPSSTQEKEEADVELKKAVYLDATTFVEVDGFRVEEGKHSYIDQHGVSVVVANEPATLRLFGRNLQPGKTSNHV